VKCPFCFHTQTFRVDTPNPVCQNQNCGKEIPSAYVKEYSQVKPNWIHAIGFRGHGKTVYLTSLIDHIEKVPFIWSDSTNRILNQASLQKIREHRAQIFNGDMPEPTPENFPTPLLLHIKKMRRWGNSCVIMHDTAGENFADINKATTNGRFILDSNTSLFILSIANIETEPQNRLSDLFDIYLAALDKLGSDNNKKRNIVVVYTKADLIIDKLPDDVGKYLRDDNLWDNLQSRTPRNLADMDMRAYVENMMYMSNKLHEFTKKEIESGLTLINSASERNINLRFCVTSALGSAPNNENKLTMPPYPRRVLDPFFWALENNNLIA
jgi:hypothetical protein